MLSLLVLQVQSKEGTAKWLSDRNVLRVTLPLNRELEFIYRA